VRFPRNAKIFRGQLDAAPFAGVFFVFVILILMSSRMVFTPGVRIELPSVARDLPGTANPIVVVALDADGQFHYENQALPMGKSLLLRLRSAVQRSKDPLTLLIHADRNARLEGVVQLWAAAPELGFANAWVTTRSAGASPGASPPASR